MNGQPVSYRGMNLSGQPVCYKGVSLTASLNRTGALVADSVVSLNGQPVSDRGVV